MTNPTQSSDGREPVAQGDVIFVPVDWIPPEASQVESEDGRYVVAHSETGHHHIVMDRPEVKMFSGMDVFRSFLEIEGEQPATVEHLRETHTHQPLSLNPGRWMIVRQRTPTPEGWNRAID